MRYWLIIFVAVCLFIGYPVVTDSGSPKKTIALTFDDGPRPYVLEGLLPLLERYNIKTTFFVCGEKVLENKDLVKAMHESGHEIENHSWGHPNCVKLLAKNNGHELLRQNLEKTSNVIFQATGRRPRFFRPPYWEINKEVEQIAFEVGCESLKIGNPDVNTMDYDDFAQRRSSEVLIKRVKSLVAAREQRGIFNHVLTFHELPVTVEALRELIPYFQNCGYKFIRVDETK